ncbi:uncharacterized protein LOC125224950 [Leguminivora glycinivorella]|uniref:uncharacterized protein LOC125224950 n=1 Tax=Leguminivora glycinivorella TaxID=1035111 RepID=UPI00200DB190|nr:uncharacterized protein LOC125224950 [Leguminivora glycinivorella]
MSMSATDGICDNARAYPAGAAPGGCGKWTRVAAPGTGAASKILSAKDCKVVPSESLVSQHRLLILELKHKVARKHNNLKPPPKTKWYKLSDRELADEFKKRMVDKMIKMNDMTEMNECWNEMAVSLRSVAKNVLGEIRGKGKIDKDTWWWNDDVQMILKEKKNAFKEWKSVEEGNDREKENKRSAYLISKKKAKKAVAIARAKVQDKLYNHLESPQGQKDLYRIARERERNARDINHIKYMKDEEGKILTDEKSIR